MPISCHFQDCHSASGHESISCKKHYGKHRTLPLPFLCSLYSFCQTTNRKVPTLSPMVMWPMTSRDPKRSNSWPQNFWSPISPYPCKIDAWSSSTTNRKVLSQSPMVTFRWRWPLKIKFVTPKYLRFSVFMAVERRWFIIDHQHKELCYCNKTANINVHSISLYTC